MGMLAVATAAVAMNCWAAAAHRYGLPVELLYAIGQVESGHKVGAIGRNKDGSLDLGVMQINSRWLPALQVYGISQQDLLQKPCTNIQVGAWILSQEVSRFGYTWYAIGAYNAGPVTHRMSTEKRAKKIATYRVYSGKVLGRWKALRRARTRPVAPVAETEHAAG